MMLSNTISTNRSASFLVNSAALATSFTRSALVMKSPRAKLPIIVSDYSMNCATMKGNADNLIRTTQLRQEREMPRCQQLTVTREGARRARARLGIVVVATAKVSQLGQRC